MFFTKEFFSVNCKLRTYNRAPKSERPKSGECQNRTFERISNSSVFERSGLETFSLGSYGLYVFIPNARLPNGVSPTMMLSRMAFSYV